MLPDQIAYVDETSIDTCLYREYGWSQKGIHLTGKVSGRKFKRTGIVAAQMEKCIIAPLQYDGTTDSTLFEMWFETRLLPSLPKRTVIVMDNASFHRKSKLFPLATQAGVRLVFLRPIHLNTIPLNTFGLGLNVIFAKFSRHILLLIRPFTPLFRFIDYIR